MGPVCFNALQLGIGIPTAVKCQPGDTITNSDNTTTPFVRQITFTEDNVTVNGSTKNIVEADVVVSWTDSKGTHEVTSATDFSDWRQR
jgi:hypothetical protein